MSFRLQAPRAHSLKEKRRIVHSLIAQLQNRFHVPAAEIEEQDTHQNLGIGSAAIVPHSLMEEISAFAEAHTDAVLPEERRETR